MAGQRGSPERLRSVASRESFNRVMHLREAALAVMPRIYLSPPYVANEEERALLLEAFDSNWLAPLGPQVDAFEAEFAAAVGGGHAAALASGTAALHLALLILGVGAGDDVLVSSLTFAASANAVRYVGARPVFVDAEAATWNLDPALVAEALEAGARAGKLPKAVIAVDLYGQCADYERLLPVCERWGVPLVEDAAEALGASYHGRPAGSFGALAAFSFNGNKIITTSGGGMLVTGRADWAARARYLASQAREPAPHYQHVTVGYNYRLSNLLAALGRGQLRSLAERVSARRSVFDRYREALGHLPGVEFMPEPEGHRSTRWLTCLTLEPEGFGASAEQVREALTRADIEARPVWKPMHLQPVYEQCPRFGGEVSEALFARGLCLPSGTGLTAPEQQEIIERVLAARQGAPRA